MGGYDEPGHRRQPNALSSGSLELDSGELDLNGYSFTVANLSGARRQNRQRQFHRRTLTVGTDNSSTTYAVNSWTIR